MELGIGMFGDLYRDVNGNYQPAQQRLQEIIEEIQLMDQLGLDFFGMGEHHRPDYAVSVPEILLAAASTVTKKIRLGSAVSVISSADPVKLYQSFATLDLISGGRAEITAGRGSFIESFPLYGFDLEDYDALFDEKLRLLLGINQQAAISWKGRFRPALDNQLVLPRATDGGLPVWVAVGGTPQSVQRAAALGLPVIFAIIGGNPVQFKPLFDYNKQAYLQAGHDPEKFQVGVHMHSFFGADAKATADYYYPVYAAQMDRVGRSRGWPPYQRAQYDRGLGQGGHLIIGDASQAIDKILEMQALFGLTRFSAHMDVGAPDHKKMMQSIEIFGDQIAPKIREALRQPA
ncbi:LLM class flavin-dependent oxidoreductase [Niabella terrae]